MRVRMDLAGVSFALKVVQFLDGQTAEKLDPPLDLEGGLQKMLGTFLPPNPRTPWDLQCSNGRSLAFREKLGFVRGHRQRV